MISNLTIDAGNFRMKLTVTIDDELVEEAKYTSRISDTQSLIRRALEYIVAYQHAELEYERTGEIEASNRKLRQLYDGEE